MTTTQKTATASVATASAMALCFALVPSPAQADPDHGSGPQTTAASQEAPAEDESQSLESVTTALNEALNKQQGDDTSSDPLEALAEAKAENASPAQLKAAAAAAAQERADEQETKEGPAAEQDDAEPKAEKAEETSSDESATTQQASAPAESYTDDLDGWIREALDIMEEEGIPGSYEGLHRNIIRESAGDPTAVNDWDINAQNGVPSKGLLQVIQPTFDAYHVEGTEKDLFDPVANLTAAANYAADRYGSIDNVDGPY